MTIQFLSRSTGSFEALASLVAPVSVETFLSDYWERAPLLARRPAETRPLATLAEIDAVLSTERHVHPNLSLVDAAKEVDEDEYVVAEHAVDMARALKRFNQGATFVLNRLDEHLVQVRDLCVKLEAELGLGVQANMYLTPAGSQGFPTHFDSHDVIIIQCVGRKTWRLYDTPRGLPMRGERFDRATTPAGPLSATLETGPGDALYIPRGLMHDALADSSEASLHVTLGFHAVRWSEVVLEAVAQACVDDPALRRGVPFGALHDERAAGLEATLREHLERVIRAVKWAPVHAKLVDDFAQEHRESLGGMLLDAARPAREDSSFAVRAGVVVSVEPTDNGVVLTVNGRSTRWPAHAESTLRRAFERRRFTLADLGEELDVAGRLTLARKLVLEGALRVLSSSEAR
jgi:ribosomal protein L16 Arg81 hydroxylase